MAKDWLDEWIKDTKDWTGNKKTTFTTLGASNHTDHERAENDFYSTDPKALEIFLDRIKQDNIILHNNIWECACGDGVLSKVLLNRGYSVLSTDLVDRGYGDYNTDFLLSKDTNLEMDILTNPPFKYAQEFIEKALDCQKVGYYTIMFLKVQFLEGQGRYEFYKKNPPKYIYGNSSRQICYLNGEVKPMSSASFYCWYVWENGFKGEPIWRWIE